MRAQNKFEKFLMNDEWVESDAPLIRGLNSVNYLALRIFPKNLQNSI